MESTEMIWLMAGLAMLALMMLAMAARVVAANGLGGLSLGSGLQAARFAHLALGMTLRGLVPLLAR